MNHKDTPQPNAKRDWFMDENGLLDRPWDEEDEARFNGYLDVLQEQQRNDLILHYLCIKDATPVHKLLIRMEGAIIRHKDGVEAPC